MKGREKRQEKKRQEKTRPEKSRQEKKAPPQSIVVQDVYGKDKKKRSVPSQTLRINPVEEPSEDLLSSLLLLSPEGISHQASSSAQDNDNKIENATAGSVSSKESDMEPGAVAILGINKTSQLDRRDSTFDLIDEDPIELAIAAEVSPSESPMEMEARIRSRSPN